MLNLGLFGLVNPWLLTALVALPALWWLLRVIPPAPKRIRFPAIRFLLGLEPDEQTSAKTPWWLLLLRLCIAALLILAFAGPILNPEPELSGRGPLVVVIDNGWASAPSWASRTETLGRLTAGAVRTDREVVLVGTAPEPDGIAVRRMSAGDALDAIAALEPKSWPVDRAAAAAALEAEVFDDAEIVWLSDGVAGDAGAREDAAAFAAALRQIAPLQVYAETLEDRAALMQVPEATDGTLAVTVVRAGTGLEEQRVARLLGGTGEILGQTTLTFEPDAQQVRADVRLPQDVLNRVARIELVPRRGVGELVLLDERWRRRTVGLVGLRPAQAPQPLLSELYYVERALAPAAELRYGTLTELLDGPLSAIVLPDAAPVTDTERLRLEAWVEGGGVLVRFAGSRLANAEAGALVPVRIRRGDRNLDGALTWARPLPLSTFDPDGPLAGLVVPEGDVVVRRQVLAQPGPDLAERTWARLEDGTPLITGEQRGEGWLALVHTSANTTWSSLPLSGVFVEALRRMVSLGTGAGGFATVALAPIEVLDGSGMLTAPGPGVEPIPPGAFEGATVGPLHPPGLYGPLDADADAARRALNVAASVTDLQPLGAIEIGPSPESYEASAEIDLMPWLLTAALILTLADMIIGLLLRGLLPMRRRVAATAAGVLLVICLAAPPAGAQSAEDPVVEATASTRLAYVVTGLAEVDEASRAGLAGLSRVLQRRTAIEAGDPRAVDVARDDLDLFPLLYWPMPPEHPELGSDARDRIGGYLRNGGMILFDTGDAGILVPGQPGPGPGERRLRDLLDGLSLPPLQPLPEDHTLTRSFYLLQDFPGRFTGRPLWVDIADPSVNDGVSTIVIGGHDWSGAWAIDEFGRSLFPVSPGGERQREIARRFGVNLVMYALTGNYKTDQVHIPALLERLGQ